jgi:hypothetical protein
VIHSGADALTARIDRWSRSWRIVVTIAVLFAVSFGLLMLAASAFREVTLGLDPFDLQNGLTSADVSEQLASYTDASTARYLVFALVDLAFPLLGSLLLACVTAACLRSAAPSLYGAVIRTNLLLLFLVPALLDWTENVFAVWTVVAGQGVPGAVVGALVVAKTLKVVALAIAQATCAAVVLWWAWTRLRRRRATP